MQEIEYLARSKTEEVHNYILIPAYAKLNLYLRISSKRQDNYHELQMIMQRISLHDDVCISKRFDDSIRVDFAWDTGCFNSNQPYNPEPIDNSNNLAYKAAQIFFATTQIKSGVDIKIIKRIPTQAGLAGGSSDAAAVLLALNLMYNAGFSLDELREMGIQLGADVPFCIGGGTAAVTGIGENIIQLNALKKLYVIIVKPFVSISTKIAFANYDKKGYNNQPFGEEFENIVNQIQLGNVNAMLRLMHNDLEDVAFEMYEELKELKNKILEYSDNALMTGSGTAVFTIFDDFDEAQNCLKEFKKFEKIAQVFFTKII